MLGGVGWTSEGHLPGKLPEAARFLFVWPDRTQSNTREVTWFRNVCSIVLYVGWVWLGWVKDVWSRGHRWWNSCITPLGKSFTPLCPKQYNLVLVSGSWLSTARPRVGPGHSLSPLSIHFLIFCSFLLFPFFLFLFALPVFFFCPSLYLFYRSSPTPFPGRRS